MNEAVFQNDLLRGEKILWVGQPETKVWFTGADIFLVPFSLVWSGIAITAAASAIGSARGMGMFVFIPLLFAIFGVYFVLGRFVYKYWRKKNTYYAVTDKRVLVRTRLWGDHLQAANVDTIPSITKSVGRGGIGTISPAPPPARRQQACSSRQSAGAPPACRPLRPACEVVNSTAVSQLTDRAPDPGYYEVEGWPGDRTREEA